jgi:hypothetical protein
MTLLKLRKAMTLPHVRELREDVVTKEFNSIQQSGNGQLDGVTMDLSSFSTVLQALFAEGADYTKKSMETRLAFVEKLVGAKSLETVIQIQSDYAKTAYAAFIAQATKIGRTPFHPRQVSLQAG